MWIQIRPLDPVSPPVDSGSARRQAGARRVRGGLLSAVQSAKAATLRFVVRSARWIVFSVVPAVGRSTLNLARRPAR
jgi:hypothetical protein